MCVARECYRERMCTDIEQPRRRVHENKTNGSSAGERLPCIGVASRVIVEPTHCHLFERRWQSAICIGQYLDTSALERARNRERSGPIIVVAENREASCRCRDLRETLGDTADIMVADRNEVAAEEQEVGRGRREGVGGAVKQPARRQRTGVKVARECNPEVRCRSDRTSHLYSFLPKCDLVRRPTTLRESSRPVGRGQERLGVLPQGTQATEVSNWPFSIHGFWTLAPASANPRLIGGARRTTARRYYGGVPADRVLEVAAIIDPTTAESNDLAATVRL